ncbi:MAG: protein BatD [Saprospiraceae bacterium]|nr:protein BatD [Saprospiraceae bacterium]
MSFKFVWPLMMLLLGLVNVAGAQVRFEAATDAKEVLEGNFFEVRFTLYNANGSNFAPPDFRPFKVVSGPNRSLSTTSINGNVSHEMTISYTLLAEKPGQFRVNPASIKVKGKLYSTQALTVEVLKGGTTRSPGTPGQEIFLVATVSDSIVYPGQQVLLDYKIYTTKSVESYNLLKESDYEGFFVEDIKRFNPRPVREVINGIQYTSKIIKRLALFPQQTGTLEIEPMMIQIGIETGSSSRRGFFLTRDLEYQNLGSNNLKIEVRNFPGDIPEDFSGAVGKYQLSCVPAGTRLYTDNTFALKVVIKGNGDNKRVLPPDLKFPEGFEPYPSKVLSDLSQEVIGEINHVKEIEYLAVPKVPGNFTLQPTLTYFDTDASAFITLKADSLQINVLKGSGNNQADLDEIDAGVQDIHPIVLKSGISLQTQHFFAKGWVYGMAILPLVGIGFLFFQRKKKANEPGISKLEKLRKEAEKVALSRLEDAAKAMEEKNSGAFYEAISTALFGYVRHKLNLSMAELTKANARKKLEEAGADTQQLEDFQQLVNTCEMALFAGKKDEKEMAGVFEKARTWITNLETKLG